MPRSASEGKLDFNSSSNCCSTPSLNRDVKMIFLVAIVIVHLFYFNLRPPEHLSVASLATLSCCLQFARLLFFKGRVITTLFDFRIDFAAHEQGQPYQVQPEHQRYNCAEASVSCAVARSYAQVQGKKERPYKNCYNCEDRAGRYPFPILLHVRPEVIKQLDAEKQKR